MSLWMLILAVVLLLMGQSVTGQTTDTSALVKSLSLSFSEAFSKLKTFLNADNLAKKIQTTPKSVDDTIAMEILTNSKQASEALVNKVSSVVDIIQSNITSEFAQYASTPPPQYGIDCSMTNYMFYFRSKNIKNGSYELQNCSSQFIPFANDSFLGNIKTNRRNSTVHIPTNVFDSSNDIQNVANYTQNIDRFFAVAERMPQIKWQFFCSNTGFFKIFPGFRWNIQIEDMEKDNTKVDFFDCRSEQWFLEATAYPKKMVIMVDKSGSMKGRRRIIANHTIYEILNTITENDYFNVILFTKDILFADNKTSGILMQATDKNKKFIMEQLDISFVPDGIAEYDIGLKASLDLLQNVKNMENSSTTYNYLVMVITDGSPFNYQEIIEVGNKLVNARIFTYLIGQASSERDIVKQIACLNKGYAVEIATLADVKENVQKYLNVVARPNAIMKNSFFIWTGVNQYQMRPAQDEVAAAPSIISPQQMGLSTTVTYTTNISQTTTSPGIEITVQPNVTVVSTPVQTKIEIPKYDTIPMFVTVSKAAYDTSNNTIYNNLGILLGAAGVDVPVTDFLKTAPFWKIGVNAYLFGVTHNGFVVFHPRFRPQYRKFIKYFYRNVDINEVEVSLSQQIPEIIANQTIPSLLRDRILATMPDDPPKFLESRTTYDVVDDFRTAIQKKRRYFISGIQNTPYRFGLAVPENQIVSEYQNPSDYGSMDLSAFSEEFQNSTIACNSYTVLANQSGLALKNYELCNLNKRLANLWLTNPLCALREVLINQTQREVCLSVSGITNQMDTVMDLYIRSVYNEASDTRNLSSEWSSKTSEAINLGVQQIFSFHHFGLIRYFNYQNLSYEQFIADHNAGSEDPLYQETILTSQNLSNPGVLIVRPLPNNVVKKTSDDSLLVFTVTTPIVTGAEYKGIIGVQLNQAFYTKILMTPPCTTGTCLSCNNTSMLDCYVVTRSGLVVFNNLNKANTGEQLKKVDCKLMESLINNSLFQSQSLYDFQSVCTNIPKIESFANVLINPFTQLFRLCVWLLFELIIFIQNFSLASSLWTFSNQEANPPYPVESVYDGRPCFNRMTSYNAIGNTNGSGTIVCSTCTKNWSVATIENTNLILIVVVKQNAACACECPGGYGDRVEIKRNISQPIENPEVRIPNYFNQFVPFTKTENSSECSDDARRLSATATFVITLLVSSFMIITS